MFRKARKFSANVFSKPYLKIATGRLESASTTNLHFRSIIVKKIYIRPNICSKVWFWKFYVLQIASMESQRAERAHPPAHLCAYMEKQIISIVYNETDDLDWVKESTQKKSC